MKLPHLGRFGRVVLVRIASRFRIIRSEKGWECARIGEFWARESDEYRRGQCAAVNAARLKGHRAHLGSGKGVGNARTRLKNPRTGCRGAHARREAASRTSDSKPFPPCSPN